MNNVTLGSFLMLSGLIVGCASANQPREGTAAHDPVITRADVVYDAGPALTPIITRAANGDLVVCFDTGGGDAMPDGTVPFIRSTDGGKTWSKPFKVYESGNPLTGLAVWIFSLPDGNWSFGRKMLYFLEAHWTEVPDDSKPNFPALAGQRKFDSYFAFTDDEGLTHSEKQLLSDPVNRNDFAQGNPIELPNGDLLWPWGHWGAEPLNGFRRSTNAGRSWEPVERAWQDPPLGYQQPEAVPENAAQVLGVDPNKKVTPLVFNETAAVVCKDGTIVAIARVDTVVDKKFWQIKSSDNGKTWSNPRQIEIAGGSPALYCTPQGQLLLAYRDGGYGPGLGLAASDDNGETWRFLYHLKEPKGEHEQLYGHIRYTDEDRKKPWRAAEGVVGYPCFVKLSDTEAYIVYHAHNRGELPQRFPKGAVPFYIVGNVLEFPAAK
jgi:hypothetical protein